MSEKPIAAFVLSFIGAIFFILNGVWMVVASATGTMYVAVGLITVFMDSLLINGIVAIIVGVIILIGAIMINSREKDRVRAGSIIVLIFSIVSLVGAGFIIGIILCLISSILGRKWKPSAAG